MKRSASTPTVDVVLPVLNEREAICGVVRSLPGWARPLVVDNGSTDGSAEVARELGVEVVVEPRRGFGSACAAGLDAAVSDIVCFMDCDGSLDGGDVAVVVEPIAADRADLVLGARRATTRAAWPAHLRLANRVLGYQVRRRTGLSLTDLGPLRAARRDALLALEIEDRRFGWPLEMVVRAAESGWRVSEVAVAYRPRVGTSKVTGTVVGAVRTVRDMRAALR
jgi:glycosyltransferase involved in cell wall biosynthesis